MAIEVIQQILAPDNAPTINGVRAEAKISQALLENMFQGLVETAGRGVNDKYVTEEEANTNAQIFVNRVVPIKMKPREMGSTKNGGSFSNDKHFVQTETVGIDILQVIDDTIYIPRARQDTIKVDLLAKNVDVHGRYLNTVINGATAGAHILSAWQGELDGEYNAIDITEADITGGKLAQRFMELNSLLDEGDDKHGIDVFPEDGRIAVFKMGFRPILKAGGVLMIGGSNYAQAILKGRSLAEGARDTTSENGYWGDIDGVPCHGISNESLRNASEFMGLPSAELKKSSFVGYIASDYATARGVSMIASTKIVPAIEGQGIVLQPFTKFGVKSWYPLGNALMYRGNADKVGFLAELKTIFEKKNSEFNGISFKLKGAGSRLYPTFGAVTASKASGIKVTATALDDAGSNHVKLGHYVQTDAPVETVEDFYKACKANGVNDDLTSLNGGATTASTITVGKFINVLVISDDGSVALTSVKATA